MADAGVGARTTADGEELRSVAHPQDDGVGLPRRDGHAEQALVPLERPRRVGDADGHVVQGGDGNGRRALRERPRGQRRRAEGAEERATGQAARLEGSRQSMVVRPVEVWLHRSRSPVLGKQCRFSGAAGRRPVRGRRLARLRHPPRSSLQQRAAPPPHASSGGRPLSSGRNGGPRAPSGRDAGFHHGLYGTDDCRRGRKNSRRSFTRTSGCSIAAKWPPRSTSVQWVMLYDASAQRRGVMNSS